MFMTLFILYRYIRLTTRRYGVAYLRKSKPRHAGVGRGVRKNPLGRAHGWGTPAMHLIRQLQLERSMAYA